MIAIVKKGRWFVRDWAYQATQSEDGGSFITGWTADPEEARTFIASLASIVAEAVGGKVISVEVDS